MLIVQTSCALLAWLPQDSGDIDPVHRARLSDQGDSARHSVHTAAAGSVASAADLCLRAAEAAMLHGGISSSLGTAFIGAAAPLVARYPRLARLFVEAISSLPTANRQAALGLNFVSGDAEYRMPYGMSIGSGRIYGSYVAAPVSIGTDAVPHLLTAITSVAAERHLDSLMAAHIDLILAALRPPLGDDHAPRSILPCFDVYDVEHDGSDVDDNLLSASSSEALTLLLDYLLAAMASPCNASTSTPAASAVAALHVALSRLNERASFAFLMCPTFQGALLLLHDVPRAVSSGTAVLPNALGLSRARRLLRAAARRGPASAQAVATMVSAFFKRYPLLRRNSPIATIIDGAS